MNIIIVGGGFAGRAAAESLDILSRHIPDSAVILIDENPYTVMPPALPWIVSGEFGAEAVTGEMEPMLPRKIAFRRERVTRVDLRTKTVTTAAGDYPYDYLVLACGSVTNFHGFNQSLEAVHKLDGVEDAQRLSCALTAYLERSAHPVCVIAGGSYTGIELACKVYALGRRYRKPVAIVIVEAGPGVLGLVDERTREFAREHIAGLGLRIITGSTVEAFDGRNVRLRTGETFEDAILCWCAGTTRALKDIAGDFETLPDGRIIVNDFLQLPHHPEVFAPADTGAVKSGGQYIRKAVNFALYAGAQAGNNIWRLTQGRPLRAFHPTDLGEVLPLYGTSAGFILGKFITGRLGLRLHYFMTGYRNFTAANRLEFFVRALTP
jgi:NADH dehydrogenase